ncbi:MAG: HAMP domain-containing sensor histidine kinase [Anaerolineae bacterium]
MNTRQNFDENFAHQIMSQLGPHGLLPFLNSIRSPLVIIDTQYTVVAMNNAAQQLFAIDSNSPESTTQSIPQIREIMDHIDSKKTPNEWTYNDRTFVPTLEPVQLSDGNVLAWTLVLNEISYFKKLTRNQSESMRIVLHDLRSPLTSMHGFASMMEMVGDLNDRQRHFVSKILSGITQMTALVENVQDAGRYDTESGFYELVRSPTDIGDIAKRIIENHLAPEEKNLEITIAVSENVPIVSADQTMLERAIRNLIDNAIKYTPASGSIHVSVSHDDKQIIVSVKDSGLGISPQNQSQLFERHVRIHRPEFKKIKGTGLGLFIVRSVARRHGGDAFVESKEGEGSNFFITIPFDASNGATSEN